MESLVKVVGSTKWQLVNADVSFGTVLEKNFTVTLDEIYLPFLVNKQSEKSLVTFVEVVKLYITIEEKILCWKAFEKHGVLFQVLTKVSQLLGKLCQSSGI